MDRAFWRSVREHDFALPAPENAENPESLVTPQDLAPELESYLGLPDPELRDELAYMILGTWIERGQLSPAYMRNLTSRLLANLRHGLGERASDGVFLRSFSALILTELVLQDAERPFWSPEEARGVMQGALSYLRDECDLRGYVPGKGWAHSVAHTADLLRALAANPRLDQAHLEQLIEAIGDKVVAPGPYIFACDEDERLALAVLEVAKRRQIREDVWRNWLADLVAPPGQPSWRERLGQGRDLEARTNLRLFLQALARRFGRSEAVPPGLARAAERALQVVVWY